MKFTINQIATITRGQVEGSCACDTITEFCFDSRSLAVGRNTMFVALCSEVSDGHRFIAQMVDRGVKAFLVERLPQRWKEWKDCTWIRVPNTFIALEQLAMDARNRLKGTVVAITGSQGKTVVKEMIRAMAPDKVWRSPRSWNSRLGVPMSLLEADEDAPVSVFEVGIDRGGDMERLESIVRPDIGVFTGLTSEHAAGFSSMDEKAREKAILFKNAKSVVYNSTDPFVKHEVEGLIGPTLKQGIHVTDADEFDRLAACEALAFCNVVARESGISMVSNRLDVHDGVNDCTIVYDGFTNDLRSLRSSLDFMRRRSSAHRSTTLILSDLCDDKYEGLEILLDSFGVNRVIAAGVNVGTYLLDHPCVANLELCDSAEEVLGRYDINQFSSENILIFGGQSQAMLKIKKELESARHNTIFEVNLDAIRHNFNEYRKRINGETGIVAMVKASAYGLGAVEISRSLQADGAAYLAVAVIDEGVELRRSGITMPIVVLNPVTTNFKALFVNSLEPSVFSIGELNMLVKEARKAGISDFKAHIKLDTGMHRVGFTEAELPQLIELLKTTPQLKVASIFSHLATADCPDQSDYTSFQLETFDRMSSKIMQALPYPVKRHILNTAGIETHPEYQYDMVRLGIGLYGVDPVTSEGMDLRVAATLKSTIISLKDWEAGTSIGYGRRGMLSRHSRIATVPIGYADGLDRHLSCGIGSVIVRGVKCPIVGNICMDQCMIDVTDVPAVALGDEVEIFGPNNRIEDQANLLGTIPYEIISTVSPRVKRVYYRD